MYWSVAIELLLKDIFIFSSGGHDVISFGRGHHKEHCKIILNLNHWLRRCHLKTFLI